MLKVGWHPHTVSPVWHNKNNSRSRDSLLSSEQPHLSQSFGLLPSHSVYFLSLYPSVCISIETPSLPQNCSDSCLARDERNPHYGDWGNVTACTERKMCYPGATTACWHGPALAKVLWLIWVSGLYVKIKMTSILLHLFQQLKRHIPNLLLNSGDFPSTSAQRLPTLPQEQAEHMPICPNCSKHAY